MPLMPVFIMMIGIVIILAGLLANIWWIWVIGIIVFLYPIVAIKIMIYKYDKKNSKYNMTGKKNGRYSRCVHRRCVFK
jgi:hypothetical protein